MLLLNFSLIVGAATYNVYVYEVVDDVSELFAQESVLSPPYTVTLLNPGTEYRTQVRAVGIENQESTDSAQAVTATRKFELCPKQRLTM